MESGTRRLPRTTNPDCSPTFGEEVANSITHGVMGALAVLSLPYVAIRAYLRGGVLDAATSSIFVLSLFFMFSASMLYHAMAFDSRHKAVFNILDHIAIFVAIAGSYTPIALVVIGGWEGWVIVGLQWSLVLFGILYKSIAMNTFRRASTAIYIVMGWTIVMFLPQFLAKANPAMMILIVGGGIAYSAGVFFFASRFRYAHMIWHFFVNLGALLHFIAIVFRLE